MQKEFSGQHLPGGLPKLKAHHSVIDAIGLTNS
jgi:hypothetical protein